MVDDSRPPLGEDFLPRLKALIAANRRGDAVKMFMKAVGVPAIGILVMRLMPVWKKGGRCPTGAGRERRCPRW
jgi:hypothetical protein